MNDVMVSIRMPANLLKKLKIAAQEKDYMDVSEVMRSIARKSWERATNPELFELKKLREDIKEKVSKNSREKLFAAVNAELDKIKNDLSGGELFK